MQPPLWDAYGGRGTPAQSLIYNPALMTSKIGYLKAPSISCPNANRTWWLPPDAGIDGVKAPGTAVVLGAAGTDGVNVGCGIPGACGNGHMYGHTISCALSNTTRMVQRQVDSPVQCREADHLHVSLKHAQKMYNAEDKSERRKNKLGSLSAIAAASLEPNPHH
jgi:hypothetical protein